ncbi:MAG: hypothetical protein Q9M50_06730 [Methylococcales bacterium]|nr:hypothetical protein [Methylococcales bacterium]
MLIPLTLAFLNFTDHQQDIFSSVLFLSSRNLDNEWTVVSKKNAHVIFVYSQEVINDTQWNEIQSIYPQALLVAYSVNLTGLKTPWKLLTEPTELPARSALILLLNRIGNEKTNPKEVFNNEIPLQITQLTKVDSNLFLPNNYFLGIIQESIKTGHIYRCNIQNNITLYILPQQYCYFCSTELFDLNEVFLLPASEIKITRILEIELEQQIEGLQTKALGDLLWYATVSASQGRFMENYQPDTKIHLKCWPDISLVSINESYLAITYYMTKNTANVMEIAKQTQQKLIDVIDFYNACHVLGLIETAPLKRSQSIINGSKQLQHSTPKHVRLHIVA